MAQNCQIKLTASRDKLMCQINERRKYIIKTIKYKILTIAELSNNFPGYNVHGVSAII